MTLLNRPTRALARSIRRERREQRLFFVATEDTYAPRQYFAGLPLGYRIKVHVLERADPSKCSAADVLEQLKELQRAKAQQGDVLDGDEFWMVIDTDHYAQGQHTKSFSNALKEAKDAGFHTAVSNPCFELWLLLHVAEPQPDLRSCADVEGQLRAALGSYNKANVEAARLVPHVHQAIERARQLTQAAGGWPQTMGTQVHLLVERLLP